MNWAFNTGDENQQTKQAQAMKKWIVDEPHRKRLWQKHYRQANTSS